MVNVRIELCNFLKSPHVLKMRKAIVVIPLLLYGYVALADHQDRDWGRLACNIENRQLANDFVAYQTQRIESAKQFVENCGSGPSNACIQYLLGRGYDPERSRNNCKGIDSDSFVCFKNLMGRGYDPERSHSACTGMEQPGTACMDVMISRGYDPERSRRTCYNVSANEATCISDMLQHGYDPERARSTCVN